MATRLDSGKTKRKYEVLIGAKTDGHSGLQIALTMSKAGYRVTLVAPPGISLTQSSHVDRLIPVLGTDESLVVRLCEEFEKGNYDRCLIADESLLTVVLKMAMADARYAILLPSRKSPKEQSMLLSKFDFALMAKDMGLPFPEFEICGTLQQVNEVAERFGYPVVLKAEHGYGGSMVRVARNDDDIQVIWQQIGAGNQLLVQRYVDGEIGSCAVFMEHGKLRTWVSFVHPLQWPTKLSPSVNVKFCEPEELESIITSLGERTGFDGICGLDWLLDKSTGRVVVLEFNPRPTATHVMGSHVGADFASALRSVNEGQAVYQRPGEPKRPKPVALFPQAVYCAISARKPLLALSALRSVPWGDPGIVLASLRRILTHFFPEKLRQPLRQWRTARYLKSTSQVAHIQETR